jgi:membrane dipeptidase
MAQKVSQAAGRLQVFDGHNDVLLAIFQPDYDPEWGGPRSFFERSERGHLDLPRAHEAGFAGGFFAVWVPPDPSARRPELGHISTVSAAEAVLPPAVEYSYALPLAIATTATLFRLEAESGGKLKVVRTAAELRSCLNNGVMAAILHFEGAEMIDPQLNALEVFYRAGLRSIGPAWSRPNAFCEGVPFRFPSSPDTGPGLTPDGKRLIRRCNELGVMVDLSHLNERGFWDVAGISTAPLVASHSNVHALSASPRNLLDTQLDTIRDSDGLVGVNFAVAFTRDDGKKDGGTPLELLARHFEYMCERIGPDHVAFGSDFDGTKISDEMHDVAGLPKLVQILRDRGFSEVDLRKMGHENWLRVLGATWKE